MPAPPAPHAAPASGPERSAGRSERMKEARERTGQARGSRAESTGQGWEGVSSDDVACRPQGRRGQELPFTCPSRPLQARTLPSKWIFLLRWMSSSVLFMDCTLALHSCTSWGGREWVTCSPPTLAPRAQPQAPPWEPEALKAGALLETQEVQGGPREPDSPCPAKLTSLSALKALVAMASSSEPCAVRFRMFWRARWVQ